MLGGDRERLQGPAGGRGPERQLRRRPERGEQRLANLLGMGEAGAGERGVGGLALHARGRVEHRLAMAGDEPARHVQPRRAQAMAAASIAVAAPRRR